MADSTEWQTVHDTAVTNTNPNSNVNITLDPTPICSNMTNGEFRDSIIKSREEAVGLIQKRIAAFARWDAIEQARAKKWLGRSDNVTRIILQSGLLRLLQVMKELKPENIIRGINRGNETSRALSFPTTGLPTQQSANPTRQGASLRYTRIFALRPVLNFGTDVKY
ncbi:hypothetical protein [Paraburkholderia pallida]|uniref:hypothetical protein n=1 Tax=Paraburkholderia pallida TaxID=2547399 RepID=UPI001E5B835B|nr:hypothetical protein [Paraburkholderia pallida]